jgi:hypothetical protein
VVWAGGAARTAPAAAAPPSWALLLLLLPFVVCRPAGMATFDTQKLFIAYQLEQLDAEAASKALHELLLRTGSRGAGPKPATLEQVDRYTDDEGGGSDSDGGAPGDLDSDDSDFGLPGAVSGLALARAGQPKPSSNGGSRIAAVQPPKRKAVQGAVRVRPWPAGPLPSERADTAKPDDGKGAAARDKLQRQVSLLNLLAALKIKAARLHNAGAARVRVACVVLCVAAAQGVHSV